MDSIYKRGSLTVRGWVMASRDYTTATIVCPKCGKVGTVKVSTSDYPHAKHDDFSVERLPDGFAVRKLSKWQHDSQFECIKCRVVASYVT